MLHFFVFTHSQFAVRIGSVQHYHCDHEQTVQTQITETKNRSPERRTVPSTATIRWNRLAQ